MNNIKKFTKGLGVQSVIAPLFKFCEAAMELITPFIVKDIINNGIPLAMETGDTSYIIIRFIIMLAFALGGFGFSVIAQYFAARVASVYSCRLRKGLFEHILTLSYKELDQLGKGKLLTRMTSDINQVQTGINMFLRLLLRSPFVMLGSLIMAFLISWKMGVIFALTIPLLFVVVLVIINKTLPKYVEIQSSLDEVTRLSRENLSGVRVVRAFTYEEKQTEKFNIANEKLKEKQYRTSRVSALINPISFLIVNVAIIAVVYLGGFEVNVGDLKNGDIIALFTYMNLMLVETIKFANLIVTLTKAIASAKRVNAMFDVKNSIKTEESIDAKDKEYIEFDNVNLSYNGNGYALENINVKIKKGSTIGIIGGTGSGKTSFINLLCHFYDVTDGQIYFDGHNLNSYSPLELRKKIGLVPQKAVLFKGTIRSNLLWGNKDATEEDINEALKTAQALEVVKGKTKGLDEEVEQGGKYFSGGQRQRLTIARALVKKPEILILDDSSSALDFETDLKLRRAIKELNKDMTVFIISQRTSSLLGCDNILLLNQGKLVDEGTHEELLSRNSLYQEIHSFQFGKGGTKNEK
jgi:ABC-type multidrug transport system fused ATPase/permease subunit